MSDKYRMSDHCCMDNQIFDVNGAGPTMLAKVLEIALLQGGHKEYGAFKQHPAKGIILYWTIPESGYEIEGVTRFMVPPTAAELARQICEMIVDAKSWFNMKSLGEWEDDCDHDGSNSMGWYAYCEDWGHVDKAWQAVIAVKPCFMWHGK